MRFDSIFRKIAQYTPEKYCVRFVALLESRLGIGSGASCQDSGEDLVQTIACSISGEKFVGFDVGANFGQYLLPLYKKIAHSSDFEIHCFEPASSSFQKLVSDSPRDERIFFNNFALGSKSEILTLYSDFNGSQLASLCPRDLEHYAINHSAFTEQVPVHTIDNYCIANKISQISLLKMDVEGYELDVLKGAETMLRCQAIDSIQFEFGGCNIDSRTFIRDFFKIISSCNMSLYRIMPSGKLFYLKDYCESLERFSTTNFFAINKKLYSANSLIKKYVV